MKHKTRGFIAMILALCLMMSLGVGALAGDGPEDGGQGPDSGQSGGGAQRRRPTRRLILSP